MAATARFPLSAEQDVFWSPVARETQLYFALKSGYGVDRDRLRAVILGLLHAHDSLRMHLADGHDKPLQYFPTAPDCIDAIMPDSDLWPVSVDASIHSFLDDTSEIFESPLFRVVIFHTNDGGDIVLVRANHMVCDRWAMGVLRSEIVQQYARSFRGLDSGLLDTNGHFIQRLKRQLAAGERLNNDQRKFWLGLMNDQRVLKAPHQRPAAFDEAAEQVDQVICRVPSSTWTTIRKLGYTHNFTLPSAIYSAIGLALQAEFAHPGAHAFTLWSARERSDDRSMIALLNRRIALLLAPERGQTFYEGARTVQARLVKSVKNSVPPYSFRKMLQECADGGLASAETAMANFFPGAISTTGTGLVPHVDITNIAFDAGGKSSLETRQHAAEDLLIYPIALGPTVRQYTKSVTHNPTTALLRISAYAAEECEIKITTSSHFTRAEADDCLEQILERLVKFASSEGNATVG